MRSNRPPRREVTVRSASVAAKKYLGQHFLIDQAVLATIVETAELAPDARVLEIGPGHGVLTAALADAVPNGLVLAIEKDRELIEELRERFVSRKHVKIVAGDILGTPLATLLTAPYQIVANIPYAVTSPIITKFLLGDYRGRAGEASPRPESMTLLIQKEVAERLVAEPGQRARGILTVLIELFGSARLVATVSRGAFDPPPRVESAVIRIDLGEPQADPHGFLQLLKAGFSAKRRQLHNSLAGSLHLSTAEAKAILERAGINPLLRAEQLTLGQWLALLVEVQRG
ncbi:ribosomal RNA small subunit methyltransferase A [Candidatus Berkelbacteria bacterium]|nr:ribosomal RNA small subunit methyltransferase A [Candidatus Berkelbacteria bacterium]